MKTKLLHRKCEQLWMIAARNATGDYVKAVAEVWHDIQVLLNEAEPPRSEGKTLCEVFDQEKGQPCQQ